jgi:5-hydroxyisourate hydrolase
MPGKLTTHVLDIANGKPAAGLKIQLHRIDESIRFFITETRANADGRTDSPMLGSEAIAAGIYELTFHVSEYFGTTDGFLDTVPIRFRISDPDAHYHVPLLCSPWAYSTYRGS